MKEVSEKRLLGDGVNLSETAKKIRELHSTCVDLSRQTQMYAQGALAGAVMAGDLLIGVRKSLNHGEWIPWLRENLSGISHSTINRYMRVARRFPNEKPGDLNSTLIEAYRSLGILPQKAREAKTSAKERSPSEQIESLNNSATSLGKKLRKWRGALDRDEIESDLLEALRNQLQSLREEIDSILKGAG